MTALTGFQFSLMLSPQLLLFDPMPRKYRLREERRSAASAAPEGPAVVNMTFPGLAECGLYLSMIIRLSMYL